jgi:hypothetical protein
MRVIAANAVLSVAFILLGDFVLTQWMPPPGNPDKEFRISEPRYSHTLRPGYSTDRAAWGTTRFPVRTNSLGFRDASDRQVAKLPDQGRRVVVIGDSFTEGIGLAWEDTFVGMFARDAGFEVLNAGVLSYAPSVYYRKTAWLLDAGYKFDELIVYMDISDVQDEAVTYREEASGAIVYVGYAVNFWATVDDPAWLLPASEGADKPPVGPKAWLKNHFAYLNMAYTMLKLKLKDQRGAPKKLLRSYWTVDPSIPGYGEMGVEGGIRKAVSYMDRLHELLSRHGIALSVAVYPWPDQLEFDTEASRQVVLWKGWCERHGCAHFIDHFPDFFAYTRAHPDWHQRLFIAGDVHHSREASALIAGRLASTYRPQAVALPARRTGD